MPNTARGGGISRKITNAADRKKLKEISGSITVPDGAGLIIRTAGASRTKTEIKRDYEYLLRQWEQIRDLTLKSIAPCADLRGRQPDQAGDPRPLQPRHGRDPGRWRARLPRGQGLHEDAHAFAREEREALRRRRCRCSRASRSRATSARCSTRSCSCKSGGYIVIDVTEALVGDRRELGPRHPRGLDRGDRAQDQPRGRRGGGAADAAARPRRPRSSSTSSTWRTGATTPPSRRSSRTG